ncbi:MAG: DUF2157 domain-containing protein [Methylacidiphilales bacterium]|nr:DUF2157 domain-containing protein [Candidatus Methylacidiphilales bacterium]MDW8349561.1 DUF2157 domain-containing protein [Verrucomicrobiae bacterium]
MKRSQIETLLQRWMAEGLIEPRQAEAILARYPLHSTSKTLTLIFAVIGVGCLILGLTLYISSNWEAIPDLAKLIALLALLTLTGILAIESHSRNRPTYLRETAYAATAILPLLTLALITQTFHIYGDLSHLFLVWAIALVPLTLLSLSTAVWCFQILAFQLYFLSHQFHYLTNNSWLESQILFAVVLALISQLWRLSPSQHHRYIGEYWALLSGFTACYIHGFVSSRNWWFLIAAVALLVLIYSVNKSRPHLLNLALLFLALIMIAFFFHYIYSYLYTALGFMIAGFFILATTWAWWSLHKLVARKSSQSEPPTPSK